jgi:hypothetical protein
MYWVLKDDLMGDASFIGYVVDWDDYNHVFDEPSILMIWPIGYWGD